MITSEYEDAGLPPGDVVIDGVEHLGVAVPLVETETHRDPNARRFHTASRELHRALLEARLGNRVEARRRARRALEETRRWLDELMQDGGDA